MPSPEWLVQILGSECLGVTAARDAVPPPAGFVQRFLRLPDAFAEMGDLPSPSRALHIH
jgi:hypothetical protein